MNEKVYKEAEGMNDMTENEMEFRVEKDSIGTKDVPENVYYGVQSLRAAENFHITGLNMHPEIINSLAYIKKAAAITNCEAGLLDKRRTQAIVQACDEILEGKFREDFIVDPIQGGAGTSLNMNANEVIANRAIEILGGKKGDYSVVNPNDHVNCGQSTNDVIPTAGKMTSLRLLKKLKKQLLRLHSALEQKADEFDSIIKMGRTQLQDAVPIRFSQEISGWRNMLEKTKKMLEASLPGLKELALGGTAVGTGLNAPKNFGPEVAKVISELTGKEFVTAENKFHALTAKDDITFAHGALKALAADLMKIANDVRWLASGPRCGLGEISIPENEPGSSIMPGKVNPVIPEVVSQVAFHIVGHDTTITMAAEAGQLELNAFEPVVFCNLFESITTLEKAVDTLIVNCITGITANRKHCKDLMESSAGIATALCPHIGYKASATIAKTAVKTGKSVRELVLEQGIMTEKELEEVLDPYLMTEVGEERKEDEARRKAC